MFHLFESYRIDSSTLESKKAIFAISSASFTDKAKTEGQSRLGQQGTNPLVLNVPLVGLSPIILFSAAGIRPEPPVSVPKEKHTCFFATDKAEPELEPPDTYSLLKAEEQAP